MPSKLRCAACGEEKKTEGGKMCEKGHFVCYACTHGVTAKHACPLCGKRLR